MTRYILFVEKLCCVIKKRNGMFKKGRNGYITLMIMLVISTVGMAISVSLLLLGLNSSRISFSIEQSGIARALADTCADEALFQIELSPDFSGTGMLSTSQGSCVYEVTKLTGENRIIESSSSVSSVVRKVKIIVDAITPRTSITSWQEVPDF